jgi:hypothetical protein
VSASTDDAWTAAVPALTLFLPGRTSSTSRRSSRAFDVPLELSPVVEPSVPLVEHMTDGRLEGIVLKDRTSTYRDGTRAGWTKVKDRSWYVREAWRFDRR